MEAVLNQKDPKNPAQTDPHAEREAEKYEKPIPSREYLLELLEQQAGPVSWELVADTLELQDEDRREGVRRRLIAMSRDGQIASNRAGDFGVLDKMSLVRGRVIGHRDGFGFVSPKDGGDDLYLAHRQMRKVFDGDEVLVRETPGGFRGKREGAVVRVIKHNTHQLAGRLFRENGICFVRPDNPRVTLDVMVTEEKTRDASNGQYVVVDITTQPSRTGLPQGEVVEVLGDHLAPGMEIDLAIRNYALPHVWPSAVLTEVETIADEVVEADKKIRVDLRQLPLVTIDGEDARDFDDAVFCEVQADNGWKLLVAIADVSHYVHPGSALDEEGHARGNSVYFPDFVLPMLPEKLSNGLCSLNPEVDRLCMVCEMHIEQSGDITHFQFFEGVMRSHARFTYTQVGQIIEEREARNSGIRKQFAALTPHLDNLYNLYGALRAARDRRGAIDFETTETRIIFDENRKIERIVPVVRNDAHKLIEECMLAANVCAAELMELSELPTLYRVHDLPKQEKLTNLREYLGELGLSLSGGIEPQPKDYQTLLESIQGRADAHIIQTMLLRSMNQAVYQPENKGHFGLDYRAYAHFTSPIRRYPDLLLHRGLRWLIRNGSANKPEVAHKVRPAPGAKPLPAEKIIPYNMPAMVQLGEHCSMTERRADDATRDVVNWLKCEYLQDHVGEVFRGVISAVTGFGLFVELEDLFVEGLIHVTALPKDYYRFEQAHQRLIGERSGTKFHLGDSVTVQVARVDLDERKVDFAFVELLPNTKRKLSKEPKKTKAVKKTKDAQEVKVEKKTKAPEISPRAVELAVEHQQERQRRGKQDEPQKKTEKQPGPWGSGLKKSTDETPFRKRKVGSDQASPVALKPETTGESAQRESEGEIPPAPAKKRGPKHTPPRKGGKRPSVVARKAAHKAAKGTDKNSAKSGGGKKKPAGKKKK